MTVLLWRGRFLRERMAGLADAPRPGREPTYDRAARGRVIAFTLEPPPFGTTHWSSRAMAARTGISVTTVQRTWAEASLRPHRVETFKFSTDADLVAKVRDVVGLYLAPPERAIVLSVDEKTQIQALDRTAPMLPMKPGQVERHTHDYKQRHHASLRRSRSSHRQGDHTDPYPPHGRGLPCVPGRGRASLSRWRPRGRARQRQLPQDAGHPRMARSPSEGQLPLSRPRRRRG
jgi:Homeodomain-like domain